MSLKAFVGTYNFLEFTSLMEKYSESNFLNVSVLEELRGDFEVIIDETSMTFRLGESVITFSGIDFDNKKIETIEIHSQLDVSLDRVDDQGFILGDHSFVLMFEGDDWLGVLNRAESIVITVADGGIIKLEEDPWDIADIGDGKIDLDAGDNSISKIDIDLDLPERISFEDIEVGHMISSTGTKEMLLDYLKKTDYSDFNKIKGTSAADEIDGTEANDYLKGYQGDDIINGGLGNDVIWGHKGNDFLYGGGGNDTIYSGDSSDHLYGEDGDDLLIAENSRGKKYMYGGDGDDGILGGRGRDVASGGRGNDIISGFEGNDLLRGNNGDDIILGGIGNDELNGGQNNDILNGEAGQDTLIGSYGADTFVFTDLKHSVVGAADIIQDFSVQFGDHVDFSHLNMDELSFEQLQWESIDNDMQLTIEGTDFAVLFQDMDVALTAQDFIF